MAPLDSLPEDQRAVLQLVLQRGRSYDEIAKILSVDRAGVRQRALAAFDAIGPQTQIPPERRALIADYLLGQLPGKVSDSVRDRLGSSPSERAWARMLASELGPISRDPLPEIPVAPADGAAPPSDGAASPTSGLADSPATAPVSARAPGAASRAGSRAASGAGRGPLSPGPRRSSRAGGAILLIAGALVVIAVVVVLVIALSGGSSSKHTSSTAARATSTATTPTSTSGTTSTAKVVAQVNLIPTGTASKAKGVAQVVRVGNNEGIVVYATGMPANTKTNFYAVWLFNSAGDKYFLGFVSPGVGANGQLQTTGALPPNTAHFKNVLVSLETQKKPKEPSQIVLHGALSVQ